ncbi:MAG: peroxiredoxin [Alphaproteobacteria bacterium]|nr:peroxiredoxin [Alphaproteobacteria bacterium]
MIGVGQTFPPFELKASEPGKPFFDVSLDSNAGKWLVIFSWPKDFTFVCPTEIAEFGKMNAEFEKRDAKVLGFSLDSEFVHRAWSEQNELLKGLPFPMMSDIKRELTMALGILDPIDGISQRATFIVDPTNVVRFVMVTDFSVGRNVQEVLRVLDALQTDQLTPCGWQPGQRTLDIHKLR